MAYSVGSIEKECIEGAMSPPTPQRDTFLGVEEISEGKPGKQDSREQNLRKYL
jgi:hypothetical protein